MSKVPAKGARDLASGVLLVAATAACTAPAPGQLVVWIDTDAPMPAPESGLLDPAPLFDSLRVDLYRPGELEPCAGCSRDFVVEQAQFEALAVSIGIVPDDARDGYRIRARLFTGAVLNEGEPRTDSTIDMTIALPSVDEDERIDVSVFLPTDNVAQPMGSPATPLAGDLGMPAFSRVGSWWGAQRTPCASATRPDDVCIPGGAYWMGSPLVFANPPVHEQRLVVLSPFFLDKNEVTVEAVRAWLPPPPFAPETIGVQPWSGSLAGHDFSDLCTYALANDVLPINCITQRAARQYCLDKGGDLPTEAQLEFAMSRFGRAHYVWGSDPAACEDVVYGRYVPGSPCLPLPTASVGGVLPVGRGARDRLDLPDGTIVDLTGNLAEWARDRWEDQNGACWPNGVLVDPICAPLEPSASEMDSAAIRGGAWWAFVPVPAAYREPGFVDRLVVHSVFTGFRCGRSDTPQP